ALPDSAAVMRRVLSEAPRVAPGTRVIYSDLNAILLGAVVQRVTGEPLDVFASREVFAPLGLGGSMFRPPVRLRPRIAPTGVWRGHPVAGVVNDGSAFKLRGVSGNAGLFATALDVARFAQFMLREGALPDGRRLLKPETVRLFTTKSTEFGHGSEARALCRQAADLVRRWDREQRIALVPFQDQARVVAFGIPLPALAAAMHLVLAPPDGRVFAGADAAPEILKLLDRRWLAWPFRLPGVLP